MKFRIPSGNSSENIREFSKEILNLSCVSSSHDKCWRSFARTSLRPHRYIQGEKSCDGFILLSCPLHSFTNTPLPLSTMSYFSVISLLEILQQNRRRKQCNKRGGLWKRVDQSTEMLSATVGKGVGRLGIDQGDQQHSLSIPNNLRQVLHQPH